MKEAIREHALQLGFDDCRFTSAAPPDSAQQFEGWIAGGRHGEMAWLGRNAGKRVDPQKVLPGAKSVICLAVSYRSEVDKWESGAKPDGARVSTGIIARYARCADYHDVLAEPLKQLTMVVNQFGGMETRSLWYVDTGPLLERDFAQRAGIGFVGKHTGVISRKAGNWILLAEIITTLDLEPDVPGRNHCGKCARCMAACPTGAITAPFQLDARRCISYLTIELKGAIPMELRPLIGNRIFGCDDCLAACPWNRFAGQAGLMKSHVRPELAEAELTGLLQLTESDFKSRFAGTPILRPKRRGLLRNVCVALGNVGDTTALPHLKRAAADPEPLIAEHAHWAISEIESRAG